MKHKSTSLYQLINSLTASEKRYFKLYAKRHQIKEINKYLVLYNIIIKNNVNSDKELESKIIENSFKKYIPVAKIQLFQNILKSLDLFHKGNSKKEQIKTWLHQAQILIDKEIIIEAKKLISKAKSLAIEYEYFSILPEVYNMIQKLTKSYNLKELNDLNKEKNHFLSVIRNNYEYVHLNNKIHNLHFFEKKIKKEYKDKQLKILFNDDLLSSQEKSLSFKTKVLFFQIKALQKFIINKPKEYIKENLTLLDLLENNFKLKEIYIFQYIAILHNNIFGYVQIGNYKEINKTLTILRQIPKEKTFKNNSLVAFKVFNSSYNIELNLNFTNGDFIKNYKLISIVNEKIKRFRNKISINDANFFRYFFLYTCFGVGKFDECIDWVNYILITNTKKTNYIYEYSARIILLLAHYELKNYKLLESTIVNTRRYLKRNNNLFELESLILSTLTKLINTQKSNRNKIFNSLKEDLIILNNNKKKESNQIFDYLAWADSKINEISFKESFKNLNPQPTYKTP